MAESWSGRDRIIIRDEVPDGVDLDALLVTFHLDGKPVPGGETGSELHGWFDMRTAPAVGDHVMLRAIGLEDDGIATVNGRGWLEHNWLMVYLERVDLRKFVASDETHAAEVEHSKPMAEIARLRAALEHIAKGNLSPCITFAERILAGDSLDEAHRKNVAEWKT